MNVEHIRATVMRVRHEAEAGVHSKVLAEKHADFAAKYPHLFRACLDVNFPLLDHLDFVLSMVKAVEAGETQSAEATSQVADRLKKQYIDPLIACSTASEPPSSADKMDSEKSAVE